MHRDIIVMGASAGGVEALSEAVAGLPSDLKASVFIVLHLPAAAVSVLPAVLQRETTLPTTTAESGEPPLPGHIYVAPPDHHLLINRDTVQLSRGAKENGHRPSIDTLFRSAARAYGTRVIGVVLSGALDDGALGLSIVVSQGGAAIVQAPSDAAFPGMPLAALAVVPDALVVPARDVGRIAGTMSTVPLTVDKTEPIAGDAQPAGEEVTVASKVDESDGPPSVFTCPECHGTLFMTEEGNVTHFRCRVGHGFSADSLFAGESEALEAALWTALRALEERNDLMRRMAVRSRRQAQYNAAERFEERVRDGEHNVTLLRQVLLSGGAAQDESA